jgi:hypothetical protein
MPHAFAKAWDHRLKIKHIFMDSDPLPSVPEIDDMARKIIEAVRVLQKRPPDTSELWHDLDNAAEEFDNVLGYDPDESYDARRHFNDALQTLYDHADYNKRIWIE